jgi:hypothetical protein
VIVTTIERLPVITRAGFDCRGDNANCPSCNWLREHGKPPDDHGISGGVVLYAVRADVAGRRFVLSIEVLAHDYPETARAGVAESRKRWQADSATFGILDGWFDSPKGAGLYLHEPLPEYVEESSESFVHHHRECVFFDGKPCRSETLTWIGADEFYKAHGFKGEATLEQLKTCQSDAFWLHLGAKLAHYAESRL